MALMAPTLSTMPVVIGSSTALQRDAVVQATAGARLAAPVASQSIDWGAVGGAVIGGITGGLQGGTSGAIAGAYGGLTGSCPSGYTKQTTPLGTTCIALPGAAGPSSGLVAGDTTTCPPGYTKIGSTCVKPSAALPGGQPLTTPASGVTTANVGNATLGMYGLAIAPGAVAENRLKCPRGMVLGRDNLCYEKTNIRKTERKWRPKPRPPVTAGDAKAIRRAASAKRRVERLARRVDLHVYKTARRASSRK